MLSANIRLPFRLLGIPVLLNWSFLIALPLVAWTIGSDLPGLASLLGVGDVSSIQRAPIPFFLGLTAAVGLFVGIVLHELGHAVTARLYGVEVRSITLWFLGGVAEFEQIPIQHGVEAVIAIVGPLVSIALAALSWVVLMSVPHGSIALRFVLSYLIYVNAFISVFNLLPALPLDGGRILRSLLAIWMSPLRATKISAIVSRVLAALLGLVGLFSFNFFLLLIAGFIYVTVNAETRALQIEELLRGVTVRSIMNPDVCAVPPDIRADDLVQTMLRERHLGFPVIDSAGHVLGFVTAEDVYGRDPAAAVGTLMRNDIPRVDENASVQSAFESISRDGAGPLLVIDSTGRVGGIVTKADLLRLLAVRSVGRSFSPSEGEPRAVRLSGSEL